MEFDEKNKIYKKKKNLTFGDYILFACIVIFVSIITVLI